MTMEIGADNLVTHNLDVEEPRQTMGRSKSCIAFRSGESAV